MQQAVVWFRFSQLGHRWSCLPIKLSWIKVKDKAKANLDKPNQELEKSWKSKTKGQGRTLLWGKEFRYQQARIRPGNKCKWYRNKHEDDDLEDGTRCKNQGQIEQGYPQEGILRSEASSQGLLRFHNRIQIPMAILTQIGVLCLCASLKLCLGDVRSWQRMAGCLGRCVSLSWAIGCCSPSFQAAFMLK